MEERGMEESGKEGMKELGRRADTEAARTTASS
jgi:hypothetical protein